MNIGSIKSATSRRRTEICPADLLRQWVGGHAEFQAADILPAGRDYGEAWRRHYITVRPHSLLGYVPARAGHNDSATAVLRFRFTPPADYNGAAANLALTIQANHSVAAGQLGERVGTTTNGDRFVTIETLCGIGIAARFAAERRALLSDAE